MNFFFALTSLIFIFNTNAQDIYNTGQWDYTNCEVRHRGRGTLVAELDYPKGQFVLSTMNEYLMPEFINALNNAAPMYDQNMLYINIDLQTGLLSSERDGNYAGKYHRHISSKHLIGVINWGINYRKTSITNYSIKCIRDEGYFLTYKN